eukprot:3412638-Ditylum_brightwellii.AAC.1
MIYYFGIVKLQAKRDYWSQKQYMSKHDVCIELDMTRDRFAFLWHHFHVYDNENIKEEEDTTSEDDEGSDDHNLQEMCFKRIR